MRTLITALTIAILTTATATARDDAAFEAYQARREARRAQARAIKPSITARRNANVAAPKVIHFDPMKPAGNVGWENYAARMREMDRRGVPVYYHYYRRPVRIQCVRPSE